MNYYTLFLVGVSFHGVKMWGKTLRITVGSVGSSLLWMEYFNFFFCFLKEMGIREKVVSCIMYKSEIKIIIWYEIKR